MKKIRISILVLLSIFLFSAELFAQETTIVTPSNEVGENLDLYAVMEVFKESESVEAFENALNNPEKNLNNLDLNNDGEVDYIRVVEEGDDQARVFILQAVVGEDLFQDVATIEVEKKNDEEWVAQAIGAEDVYGPNYIVEPAPTTVVHVNAWPIITFVWGVHHVRWHSPYYWHYYPPYYRPRPPYPVHVYRGRVTVYHRHSAFHHTTVRRTVHTQSIYRTKSGQHKSNISRTKPVTTQKQPKTVNTKNINKSGAQAGVKTPKTTNTNVNKATKNGSSGVSKTPKTTNQKTKTPQNSKATKPTTTNSKTKVLSNSQKNKSSVNKPSTNNKSAPKASKKKSGASMSKGTSSKSAKRKSGVSTQKKGTNKSKARVRKK